MNFKCIFGHSYEKLTGCVAVKEDGDFNDLVYKGHFALGKCKECGKVSMVRCFGTWHYNPSGMETLKEQFEEFTKEIDNE